MKLSIILPVHNQIEHTKECLYLLKSSLSNSEVLNTKIVVVDDGSTDYTSEWIKNNHSDVEILSGSGDLWWSGAVTMGAKYSLDVLNADYILLWNNDAAPDKFYFAHLFSLLNKVDAKTILGSKIYFSSNKKMIWSMGGVYNPFNGKKFMLGFNKIDTEDFDKIINVDWLPGMGTVIPKTVFNEIGFWDSKNFPQYHGDSDFTLRAKEHGFSISVYPKLKIWNDKSNSGLRHDKKISLFFKSFTDLRSTKNLSKDLKFYHYHSKSIFAYKALIKKYLLYILRFIRKI